MINKVEQAKTRCEEMHRELLFHLNKSAGLLMLCAECCTETNGFIFDDKSKAEYLMTAFGIYCLSWQFIRARELNGLIGLAKVGDGGQADDATVSIIDTTSVTFNSTDIATDSDRCAPNRIVMNGLSWQVADSIQAWQQIVDDCNIRMAIPHHKEPLPNVPLRTVIRFSHPKTLVAVRAVVDMESIFQSLSSHCWGAVDDEPSYRLVLFPKSLKIQSYSGYGSNSDCCECAIDFPGRLADGSGSASLSLKLQQGMDSCNMNSIHTMKSKTWQVLITDVHPVGVLVTGSSSGKPLQCTALHLQNEGKSVIATVPPKDIMCCITLALGETSMDNDHLQELHVCHNIAACAASMMAELPASRQKEPSILGQLETVAQSFKPTEMQEMIQKISAMGFGEQRINGAVECADSSSLVTPSLNKRTRDCVPAMSPEKKRPRRVCNGISRTASSIEDDSSDEDVAETSSFVDPVQSILLEVAETRAASIEHEVSDGIAHFLLQLTISLLVNSV